MIAALALAMSLVAAAPQAADCRPPTIEAVEIVRHDVFEDEAGGLFRLVNRLHLVTREPVVRRELLFAEGAPLDVEAIEQSERNLRVRAYLREATIEVLDGEGAVLAVAGDQRLRDLACAPDLHAVRVRVTTRDSWSTSLEGRFERAGDRMLWSLGLSEANFLGRGKELELTHVADIDRSSNVVAYRDPQVAGGPLEFEAMYADQSDGGRALFRVGRRLLSLETGLAWGARSESFDQVQPLYRAGERVRELRHVRRRNEVEASRLLSRNGDTAFRVDAAFRSWFDEVEGAARDFGIFEVGVRRIEHRFRKLSHINHERPEDLNLGAVSRLAVGRSPGWAIGSDRAWFFTAEHRQGVDLGEDAFVVGTASWNARLEEGELRNGMLRARLALLHYLTDRQLVWVTSEFRDGTRLDPERQLTLGADRGLRGYPVNQFAGDRTWSGTAELRWFVTDDLFRLLSVGVSGFVDLGATWRGMPGVTSNGLRRNVGVGLLLGRKSLSTRNATVRIDLAYALDPVLDRGRWLVSFNPARLDF